MSVILLFTLWQLICFTAAAGSCPSDLCRCVNTVISCSKRQLEKVPLFTWTHSSDQPLSDLDLRGNDIHSIPPFAFKFLPSSVTTIALDRNPLIGVSPRAFDGIERNLRRLDMSKTDLEVIHWGVFRGLINLKQLMLERNRIFAIPKGLFDGLKSLQELSLAYNKISLLRPGMFRGLDQLQRLDFEGNRIVNIEGETFLDLRQLVELNLNGNQLSYLDYYSSKGLDSLAVLDLTNNMLKGVPVGQFTVLHSLRQVLLSENNISYVGPRSFQGSLGLREIHLSQNNIKHVSADAFDGVPNLQLIKLDRNNIESLGERCQLNFIERIKELDLTGNPIVCDCRLAWLPRLAGKGVVIRGTCSGPTLYRDTLLSKLNSSMQCETQTCAVNVH